MPVLAISRSSPFFCRINGVCTPFYFFNLLLVLIHHLHKEVQCSGN